MSDRLKVKPKRDLEILRREPRPVLYANNTTITISPYDVAVQFGQILETTPSKLKVQEEICIYMSPQHAKMHFKLFARMIEEYEKKFGPIPEPEEAKEILTPRG